MCLFYYKLYKLYNIMSLLGTQSLQVIEKEVTKEELKMQQLEKLEKLKKLPKGVSISTITLNCKIPTLINITNVKKYLTYNNPELSLQKKNQSKKGRKKTKHSKKVKFYNQTDVYVKLDEKTTSNVKLFQNGTFQITGCKSGEIFKKIIDFVCTKLSEPRTIYSKKEKKIIKEDFLIVRKKITFEDIYDIKIRMINSNFHPGFQINREKLFSSLLKTGIKCTYEPCIHAGVNIKYDYGDDVISIFVFEGGSVVITGAKCVEHIYGAYKFIKNILASTYKQICKLQFNKYLKEDKINNLIKEQLGESILATLLKYEEDLLKKK